MGSIPLNSEIIFLYSELKSVGVVSVYSSSELGVQTTIIFSSVWTVLLIIKILLAFD